MLSLYSLPIPTKELDEKLVLQGEQVKIFHIDILQYSIVAKIDFLGTIYHSTFDMCLCIFIK